MTTASVFKTIPVGSLITRPPEEERVFLEAVDALPRPLQNLVTSPHTAAFIRGLAKQFELNIEQAAAMSFIVLRIVVGMAERAALGGLLSSELKLANDKAQEITQEIEHELFAPLAMEFNGYLTLKKKKFQQSNNKATGNAQAAGAKNILDLKAQRRPPMPPLPKR